jgi:hypothetical protein
MAGKKIAEEADCRAFHVHLWPDHGPSMPAIGT